MPVVNSVPSLISLAGAWLNRAADFGDRDYVNTLTLHWAVSNDSFTGSELDSTFDVLSPSDSEADLSNLYTVSNILSANVKLFTELRLYPPCYLHASQQVDISIVIPSDHVTYGLCQCRICKVLVDNINCIVCKATVLTIEDNVMSTPSHTVMGLFDKGIDPVAVGTLPPPPPPP